MRKRRKTPDNIEESRKIVEQRQAALCAIESLAQLAKTGNDFAFDALYRIAERATDDLNEQSLDLRKCLAASEYCWPVLLSYDKVWNERYLGECLYSLGLAQNLDPLTNIGAVAVKDSLLKTASVLLIALITGWKNAETRQQVIYEVQRQSPTKELGANAIAYASSLALIDLERTKQLNIERLKTLTGLLKSEDSTNSAQIAACREKALLLPEMSKLRTVQNDWFRLAMEILDALTASRYEKCQHGLRQWGGIPYVSDDQDAKIQGELRENIRDQMRKRFRGLLTATDG